MDSEIVGHHWPRNQIADAVVRWAPSTSGAILALADDADALLWREATSGRIQAPLVGVSPMQRRILVGLVATGHELPSWAPSDLALILAALREPAVGQDAEPVPKHPPRSRASITMREMEAEAPMLRLLVPEAPAVAAKRPRTRADCASVARPCPWVGCAHNLFLDVTDAGGITFRQPGVEPWDVKGPSCALDVAAEDGLRGVDIGEIYGITRERARQIEAGALEKLRDENVPTDMFEDTDQGD